MMRATTVLHKRKDLIMNAGTETSAKASAASKTNKLSAGDVFKDAKGATQVVWFSNETHVKYAPLDSALDYRVGEDKVIRFAAGKGSVTKEREGFSPEVLESLGRDGLALRIDARKAADGEAKKAKAEKKTSKPKKERTGLRKGTLGEYQGFSIASVVRALAWEGWTTPEIKAFFQAEKIEVGDQTIKLNVYRGKDKSRHAKHVPAPLKTIPKKPVLEKKEPKAKPADKAKAPAKKPTAKPAAKKKPAAANPTPAKDEAAAAKKIAELKEQKQAAE